MLFWVSHVDRMLEASMVPNRPAPWTSGTAVAYLVLVIGLGVVLHPELKAFYRHGHGSMKNTVSAIDTIFACLFLSLLRLATGISDRPMWEKLRWAIPPGVFVFLVITLSTWANFLSYQSFALSAPSELIFVWIFARLLQPQERQRPCSLDLPAVLTTTVGTVLLSLAEIGGGGRGHGSLEALGAALLCRASSALMMVSLRSCCVVLEGVSKKDTVSVVEIAYWKMLVTSCLCLPYAFLTEGLAPWRSIGSAAFWADHTSALLLSGSVLITMGFQWSTVGLNRSFRSPLCALLESTLKPLTACALVLVLADSPYQKILGLKQPKNATDIAGLCCLLLGLLLSAWSSWRRRQSQVLEQQSVEFLDRRAS
eukprot:s2879_g5.t1